MVKIVIRFSLVASVMALLQACTSTPPTEGSVLYERMAAPTSGRIVTKKDATATLVEFSSLPRTEEADWGKALRALRSSCRVMGKKHVWAGVCERADQAQDGQAKVFFDENFDVWRVAKKEGGGVQTDTGLMTGYYEPMLQGSRTRTARFKTPLYGVPPDLLTVELTELHPQLKGLNLKGKRVGNRVVPYDTRGEIMKRDDMGGAALCWVEDPVEAFFLQVQGSGRVQLQDGSFVRLGYAANNGHPYRALSRWLVEYAKIKPSQMSMQRIQRWAKDHPGRVNELLSYNRNYVFFMERFGFSDDEGPIGSQGVCLTPGASVAVDRSYWSMGLPFVVDVTQENPDLSFCKPVLAQDTGGAIRGVLRFDHFWGYGPEAGESAGKQKSEVRAWVLSPKGYTPWDLD